MCTEGNRVKKTKTNVGGTINEISRTSNAIITIVLLAVAVLMLAPVVLMICISFSSSASITNHGYRFIPAEWSLEGYRYLLKMGDQLLRSYMVTIAYSVLGTVLGVFIMSMYAYVITQKSFRYHRALTWFMFFTMLFSGGLVPTYIMIVRYYHMKDTFWILLFTGLVDAYLIVILRTFIKTTIPEALMDAAKIDGAGHFTTYFQIVLPLSKAGLGTAALFSFVAKWNDWFTGMLYIVNPDLIPLQTLLTKLQKSVDFLKQNARAAATPAGLQLLKTLPSTNLRMACTVMAIIPVLFAYPFFQRFFVQGLTIGSIKE